MGLKRLNSNGHGAVSIKICDQQALFLISFTNGSSECIFLDGQDVAGFDFFNNSEIKSTKFVGPKDLYDYFVNQNPFTVNFLKKIFTSSDLELWYYPETGKVRIPKNSTQSTETIKKKVLVVDDSKTIQKLLCRIINSSSKLEVCGACGSPSEAKKFIESLKPDLITLDVYMPEMNGVDFLKSYLKDQAIPVVMISSLSINEGPLIMEALLNGATTYIQKPSMDEIDQAAGVILEELENIKLCDGKIDKSLVISRGHFSSLDGLIVIGSSTGGTQALQSIFTSLPREIPPIIVVQHIPAVFSKALADRLNSLCKFTIKEAQDGDIVEPNHVYIAAGGRQMKLNKKSKRLIIELNDDAPVNKFKPSVDYFFNTVSSLAIENLTGVILTGMGKDGAKGLLNLKNSGAVTFAQDEKSCVVFGMPSAAISLGAVEHIASLSELPDKLMTVFNQRINKANKAS
ncbi:MAG: chemotaxis-specific protein-glutamate methyltransferase CheB [Bacteriovoracaceae bacterium]|jgi:two-component system, chemotaxis family, protein-glutamate methylesterase/glutaminase|nr:chemotaxis-specific protein-glutamate methyltransferase CheB [Bacteriovoracaceae bacterium]